MSCACGRREVCDSSHKGSLVHIALQIKPRETQDEPELEHDYHREEAEVYYAYLRSQQIRTKTPKAHTACKAGTTVRVRKPVLQRTGKKATVRRGKPKVRK